MLFNTLTTFGLVTIAAAAPQVYSRQEQDLAARNPVLAAELGIVWTPRDLEARKKNNKNNKDDTITITQLEQSQLTVVEKGKEIQLTEIVEDKLVVIDQTKKNKDNIRKNHFKNKNSNVNTVIIVVTQLIDQRDSSNINTRYMTHQVESNSEVQEQQIVVVSEASAMTINSSKGSRVRAVSPTGTAAVAADIATYDPKSPPSVNNSTMILPSGVAAPKFDNTQEEQDPAIIIDKDQAVLVQFVGSS